MSDGIIQKAFANLKEQWRTEFSYSSSRTVNGIALIEKIEGELIAAIKKHCETQIQNYTDKDEQNKFDKHTEILYGPFWFGRAEEAWSILYNLTNIDSDKLKYRGAIDNPFWPQKCTKCGGKTTYNYGLAGWECLSCRIIVGKHQPTFDRQQSKPDQPST
jgi:hypothetical protein